jgi:glycosyltransferase involved in cell wall biosynthesis
LIRLLALLEAITVTGPAKNLIDFAKRARYFDDREAIETHIATFRRGQAGNAFLDAVHTADIPLHVIPERRAYDRAVISRMRGVAEAITPDLVQTHAIKSHFLLRLSGLWTRYPWIASHHGYTSTNNRERIYNQLDRWSLRKAARVLTVSRAFEQQLRETGVPAGRITVLQNAIDPDWGDAARNPELRARTRASLGIAENEKAALIVGRLSREKGHPDLIRALARLRAEAPYLPVRLLIVGDGPERPAIEESVRASGLERQVFFAGQVADVMPYYAAADVVVLASITEGSPNALLEAMAARVPVVATAVGGVPEMVSHQETALLAPPHDVRQLADCIHEALREEGATGAMVERAHHLVVARHSPECRARFLSRFYFDTARGAGS